MLVSTSVTYNLLNDFNHSQQGICGELILANCQDHTQPVSHTDSQWDEGRNLKDKYKQIICGDRFIS